MCQLQNINLIDSIYHLRGFVTHTIIIPHNNYMCYKTVLICCDNITVDQCKTDYILQARDHKILRVKCRLQTTDLWRRILLYFNFFLWFEFFKTGLNFSNWCEIVQTSLNKIVEHATHSHLFVSLHVWFSMCNKLADGDTKVWHILPSVQSAVYILHWPFCDNSEWVIHLEDWVGAVVRALISHRCNQVRSGATVGWVLLSTIWHIK